MESVMATAARCVNEEWPQKGAKGAKKRIRISPSFEPFALPRAQGLELAETAAKSFLSQRGGGSNFRARNVQFSRSWRVLFNESSGAHHAAGFLVGNHDCRRGRIQSARGKRVLRGKALPKILKVRQKKTKKD